MIIFVKIVNLIILRTVTAIYHFLFSRIETSIQSCVLHHPLFPSPCDIQVVIEFSRLCCFTFLAKISGKMLLLFCCCIFGAEFELSSNSFTYLHCVEQSVFISLQSSSICIPNSNWMYFVIFVALCYSSERDIVRTIVYLDT